ncbi:hypothetical protein NM688_g3083 [Phlebia brevispora]|uniref:Uncharacterized protein n=1 Tax=Phlebia brevispora TaxID=194682 RepID=A0ACC1T6R8_9APHY|nr:hypothetical protein NM688_g3083 [Phlebia brevispora]
MRFATSIIAALAAAVMAAAQTTIMVGGDANTPGGIFQFIPPNITATNGTVVTFMYSGSPGNHTVVQSTFSNPCQQMAGGFDSGFIFVPQNTTSGFPTWNLTITNDQEPIWFYCAQLAPSPHCNAGMVGYVCLNYWVSHIASCAVV